MRSVLRVAILFFYSFSFLNLSVYAQADTMRKPDMLRRVSPFMTGEQKFRTQFLTRTALGKNYGLERIVAQKSSESISKEKIAEESSQFFRLVAQNITDGMQYASAVEQASRNFAQQHKDGLYFYGKGGALYYAAAKDQEGTFHLWLPQVARLAKDLWTAAMSTRENFNLANLQKMHFQFDQNRGRQGPLLMLKRFFNEKKEPKKKGEDEGENNQSGNNTDREQAYEEAPPPALAYVEASPAEEKIEPLENIFKESIRNNSRVKLKLSSLGKKAAQKLSSVFPNLTPSARTQLEHLFQAIPQEEKVFLPWDLEKMFTEGKIDPKARGLHLERLIGLAKANPQNFYIQLKKISQNAKGDDKYELEGPRLEGETLPSAPPIEGVPVETSPSAPVIEGVPVETRPSAPAAEEIKKEAGSQWRAESDELRSWALDYLYGHKDLKPLSSEIGLSQMGYASNRIIEKIVETKDFSKVPLDPGLFLMLGKNPAMQKWLGSLKDIAEVVDAKNVNSNTVLVLKNLKPEIFQHTYPELVSAMVKKRGSSLETLAAFILDNSNDRLLSLAKILFSRPIGQANKASSLLPSFFPDTFEKFIQQLVQVDPQLNGLSSVDLYLPYFMETEFDKVLKSMLKKTEKKEDLENLLNFFLKFRKDPSWLEPILKEFPREKLLAIKDVRLRSPRSLNPLGFGLNVYENLPPISQLFPAIYNQIEVETIKSLSDEKEISDYLKTSDFDKWKGHPEIWQAFNNLFERIPTSFATFANYMSRNVDFVLLALVHLQKPIKASFQKNMETGEMRNQSVFIQWAESVIAMKDYSRVENTYFEALRQLKNISKAFKQTAVTKMRKKLSDKLLENLETYLHSVSIDELDQELRDIEEARYIQPDDARYIPGEYSNLLVTKTRALLFAFFKESKVKSVLIVQEFLLDKFLDFDRKNNFSIKFRESDIDFYRAIIIVNSIKAEKNPENRRELINYVNLWIKAKINVLDSKEESSILALILQELYWEVNDLDTKYSFEEKRKIVINLLKYREQMSADEKVVAVRSILIRHLDSVLDFLLERWDIKKDSLSQVNPLHPSEEVKGADKNKKSPTVKGSPSTLVGIKKTEGSLQPVPETPPADRELEIENIKKLVESKDEKSAAKYMDSFPPDKWRSSAEIWKELDPFFKQFPQLFEILMNKVSKGNSLLTLRVFEYFPGYLKGYFIGDDQSVEMKHQSVFIQCVNQLYEMHHYFGAISVARSIAKKFNQPIIIEQRKKLLDMQLKIMIASKPSLKHDPSTMYKLFDAFLGEIQVLYPENSESKKNELKKIAEKYFDYCFNNEGLVDAFVIQEFIFSKLDGFKYPSFSFKVRNLRTLQHDLIGTNFKDQISDEEKKDLTLWVLKNVTPTSKNVHGAVIWLQVLHGKDPNNFNAFKQLYSQDEKKMILAKTKKNFLQIKSDDKIVAHLLLRRIEEALKFIHTFFEIPQQEENSTPAQEESESTSNDDAVDKSSEPDQKAVDQTTQTDFGVAPLIAASDQKQVRDWQEPWIQWSISFAAIFYSKIKKEFSVNAKDAKHLTAHLFATLGGNDFNAQYELGWYLLTTFEIDQNQDPKKNIKDLIQDIHEEYQNFLQSKLPAGIYFGASLGTRQASLLPVKEEQKAFLVINPQLTLETLLEEWQEFVLKEFLGMGLAEDRVSGWIFDSLKESIQPHFPKTQNKISQRLQFDTEINQYLEHHITRPIVELRSLPSQDNSVKIAA